MAYMKNWLKNRQNHLLALVLGAVLTFAFAPYEIYPLAVLSSAGLFALIYQASPKRAFWLGFNFGFGLFGTGVYWVYISIHAFGDVPALGAAALTVAMVTILACYPAYMCYFCNRYFPVVSLNRFNFAFPALWVFGEWLRGLLFTGFPWLFIGYSQTNSPLSGFAPILGVYGVSFATVLSGTLIVYAYHHYQQSQFKAVYKHVFIMLSIWVAGAGLSLISWTHNTEKTVSVSLVQGDIPQSLKWNPDDIKLSFDRYEKMTQPLLKKDRIIIWPEAAIPLSLQDAADFVNNMDAKVTRAGAHLLMGIPMANAKGDGYYNSLISLGADKHIYLKRLLVPFGEYIPLKNYTQNALDIMKIPVPDTKPGRFDQEPLEIAGVKILPAICYEIAFPDIMRTTDKTIGMLLTVTNDAWFGKSNAQAQHLQMAAMRAIEMRRPALFVSNDGITAVINPDGRILAAAPQYEPYVLNASVQPKYGLTPWMTNGADPILAILMATLVATWLASRKLAEPEAETDEATAT